MCHEIHLELSLNMKHTWKILDFKAGIHRILLFIYWRNFSREYFILFVKNVHVDTGVLKLHFQVFRPFDF